MWQGQEDGWDLRGVGIHEGRIWIREGGDFLAIFLCSPSLTHGRDRDAQLDTRVNKD